MIAEEYLTIEQAARALRVSKSTLHHLTSRREIGFVRLGKRIYLNPTDLENYIASRRSEAVAK